MNRIILFSVVAFLFLGVKQSVAQNPFDCVSAMEVCDSTALYFQYDSVAGVIPAVLDTPNCLSSFPYDEYDSLRRNTIWLKYRFETAGDFVFTISPEIAYTDFDFLVFRSGFDSCNHLVSTRCMLSGSISNPECMGSTGLAYGSIDTIEDVGCLDGSDNFLAPVIVEAGEVLYVAIMNFSIDGFAFSMTHDGTAKIGCALVANKNLVEKEIVLSPNPVRDLLQIDFNGKTSSHVKVGLVDLYGRVVWQQSGIENIDVSSFPKGIYFVHIKHGNKPILIKKVVKY